MSCLLAGAHLIAYSSIADGTGAWPGHTIKGTPFEGGAQVLYGGHQGATVASLQDSDPRHVAAYRLAERLAVGGAPARCRARLSRESLIAATRPLAAITRPRTREFPHWIPRPPQLHPALETEDDLLSLDD